MQFNKHVLLLILTIFHSALSCTYYTKDERALCSSFDALKEAGNHYEWKKLNVINSEFEPLLPIKKETFKGYPNLEDLQVKEIANEIHPNAWKGLYNLNELHLDNNKFHVIQSEAFANLPCQIIYIYNCEVQELRPKVFNNLHSLRILELYGNNITTIEAGVFSDTGISDLIMRKNRIRHVKPNAFSNMPNLRHLSLEENELTSFAPQLTIGYARKLTHLFINRNQITKANREMFSVLPNLRVLLLNINKIYRLGDNIFTDLRNLILVDISNNRLEELQTNIFNYRGHPYLHLFFIHDNRLSFLSSYVLYRLPNLRKISLGGNPWQCPCWDNLNNYMAYYNIRNICDDGYNAGKRPSCIFSIKTPRICIYNIETVRDLPKYYEEELKEYGKLPPVCNINNVTKPVLGD